MGAIVPATHVVELLPQTVPGRSEQSFDLSSIASTSTTADCWFEFCACIRRGQGRKMR